jgi:hypothetical protein
VRVFSAPDPPRVLRDLSGGSGGAAPGRHGGAGPAGPGAWFTSGASPSARYFSSSADATAQASIGIMISWWPVIS